MSMSMMGGTGMGAAGTGMGAGAAMPAGVSPQVLAMLQMMRAQPPQQPGIGQAPMTGAVPGAPNPMQAPTGTPMAGYLGGAAGMPPGAIQRPMMPPPVGQPPGMGGQTLPGATPMPAGGGMNPQMMALLQQLKGQQSGVPAAAQGQSGGGLPMGQNPQQNWLQQMLNGQAMPAYAGGGTGAGGMT